MVFEGNSLCSETLSIVMPKSGSISKLSLDVDIFHNKFSFKRSTAMEISAFMIDRQNRNFKYFDLDFHSRWFCQNSLMALGPWSTFFLLRTPDNHSYSLISLRFITYDKRQTCWSTLQSLPILEYTNTFCCIFYAILKSNFKASISLII